MLTFPGVLEPSCFLEGGYLTPIWIDRNTIEAELSGATARAGARITAIANRGLAFDTGAVTGIDVLTLDRTDSQATDHPIGSSTRVQPVVGGFVGVRARVSRNLFLRLLAGTDIDIAPRYWVAERKNGDVPFFELARVRPFAQVGLEFGVLARQGTDSSEDTP